MQKALYISFYVIGVVLIAGLVWWMLTFTMDEAEPNNQNQTPPVTENEEAPEEEEESESPEPADFIGLDETDAASLADEHDIPHRVINRDGEPQAVTMDFVAHRLNFTVEDGTVVQAQTDEQMTNNDTR